MTAVARWPGRPPSSRAHDPTHVGCPHGPVAGMDVGEERPLGDLHGESAVTHGPWAGRWCPRCRRSSPGARSRPRRLQARTQHVGPGDVLPSVRACRRARRVPRQRSMPPPAISTAASATSFISEPSRRKKPSAQISTRGAGRVDGWRRPRSVAGEDGDEHRSDPPSPGRRRSPRATWEGTRRRHHRAEPRAAKPPASRLTTSLSSENVQATELAVLRSPSPPGLLALHPAVDARRRQGSPGRRRTTLPTALPDRSITGGRAG